MRLAWLGLALVVACSDDDQKPNPSGSGIPAEARTFVANLCDAYKPCCDGESTCASEIESSAGSVYDAARATACIDAVRAAATNSNFCYVAQASTCAAVFKVNKTLEPGATCTESRQCSNGDDGDGLCILDKCRRVSAGKEGDPCVGTWHDGAVDPLAGLDIDKGGLCSGDLYCNDSSRKCEKRGAIGTACSGADISCVDDGWCPRATSECTRRTAAKDSCEDSFECAAGLRCANNGEGAASCTALAVAGDSCEQGDECDPTKGLTCDSGTSKCVKNTSVYADACNGKLALNP
jgi:hypothetical protein